MEANLSQPGAKEKRASLTFGAIACFVLSPGAIARDNGSGMPIGWLGKE